MPVTGWVISSIVVAVLGSVFVGVIAPMEKKVVRDKWGKIDFKFVAADIPSAISMEERLSVQKAVQQLPELQRAVILLTYYHDLTQKETADILGIPVGTVKSWLHHAMKKLKEDLEVDGDER